MELKEYQLETLKQVKKYLKVLGEWRSKARENPDLEIDFPVKAWEKLNINRPYLPKKDGLNNPLPNFCLKIPTGGGKTLLAVKSIDLINQTYLKKQAGLVLWVVPTTQIYNQTIKALKDKDHPYRQHLDLTSGGKTLILEKTNRFNPQDIKENLVVLMLMLPSANRQSKETLKIFQDNGNFSEFFPGEDNIKGHEKFLNKIPNLDTFESVPGIWGRQIKTSLGNVLRLLKPIIILDEGHKAYSLSAQNTLNHFNPSIIVELSATPTAGSNILVEILGIELNREEMIKLDLHITNKASQDWKDTLLASIERRNSLEKEAVDYLANTDKYIRPICLIQVERTGKDQRGKGFIHAEDVREQLINVMGIPAEQIAIKTSQTDELKEIDDIGGLMSANCPVRYIITKQALQEGWDCSFAYVLTILTNPKSKTSLTQLVGRILRQPYAQKTKAQLLDESYVFCFQQQGGQILEEIRKGFGQEGLGDLQGLTLLDDETNQALRTRAKIFSQRPIFQAPASQLIFPVFVIKDSTGWKPVNYQENIVSQISWNEINIDPLTKLHLSKLEEKDTEQLATLSENVEELVKTKKTIKLKHNGFNLDEVFIARNLSDIIPNPWIIFELTNNVMAKLIKKNGLNLVVNNLVFIIEEMRKHFSQEKDRLAEKVFRELMNSGNLRFLIIGKDMNFTLPQKITISGGIKPLITSDGLPQKSLFEFVADDDLNQTEKTIALYLENQQNLLFWFRNMPRRDYAIQGWKKHKIYPDFIFTTNQSVDKNKVKDVYVIETKGIHLKEFKDTSYKRSVFNICNQEAKKSSFNELGMKLKEIPMKFQVIDEDEWQNRLNSYF